jgi:hypothetical protein
VTTGCVRSVPRLRSPTLAKVDGRARLASQDPGGALFEPWQGVGIDGYPFESKGGLQMYIGGGVLLLILIILLIILLL